MVASAKEAIETKSDDGEIIVKLKKYFEVVKNILHVNVHTIARPI